jgi:hypothetical protein
MNSFATRALAPILVLAAFASGEARAEFSPAQIEAAQAFHEQKVEQYRANPAAVKRALRFVPAAKKRADVLHCHVTAMSVLLAVESGVCRGGGHRYAFSALGLGVSSAFRWEFLTIRGSRPFGASETLTGVGTEFYAGFGFDEDQLTAHGDGETVEAEGFGFGAGVGIDALWVTLTEL